MISKIAFLLGKCVCVSSSIREDQCISTGCSHVTSDIDSQTNAILSERIKALMAREIVRKMDSIPTIRCILCSLFCSSHRSLRISVETIIQEASSLACSMFGKIVRALENLLSPGN